MSNSVSFQPSAALETVAAGVIESDFLQPAGFRSIMDATTGLDKTKVAPGGPTIEKVVDYIKTIDFGPGVQKNDIWDCQERAIWGMTHIRHRFPGCAVGIAEGNASVGSVINQDHAVIIIWDKDLKFRYCDPIQTDRDVTFNSGPIRITAFPFAPADQADSVEPIKSLHLPRLRDDRYIRWDNNYKIYPKSTPERNGVEDYLAREVYETECASLGAHQSAGDLSSFWKAADAALWAYSHVRRVFEGCAMGVAFGIPGDESIAKVVNFILGREGGKIKPVFWDPRPHMKREVQFTPKRIFF